MPTNLGWMVGPFLIYACFLTGATLGIFNGSPLERSFGKFVQDSGTTVLGVVHSMVKTWIRTSCMDGLGWSKIRCVATTGETSTLEDDLWLSGRCGYCPVLEMCGGTELGATYLHGSLLQPQGLAVFSTPSIACSFVILDEQGVPYPDNEPCIGELALRSSFLGASAFILNADHDTVYFQGMPSYEGQRLRRHGDIVERLVGGFYRAHGRADDTMNLGGIKTSAVEIERVCNKAHRGLVETVALGLQAPGGGPDSLLIVSVVKEGKTVPLHELKSFLLGSAEGPEPAVQGQSSSYCVRVPSHSNK